MPESQKAKPSAYRILVVEDDSIISSDITHSLQGLGYDIAGTAASGEEAIKKAALLRPDLVLMDIVLKGNIDGIKAAGHIGSEYDIPVVYLTSHSDKATIKRARETGPFGYLMKPYEEKDMGATIEMALYKHDMERRLKDSEQWLSIILKSIGDAVIVTDAKGEISFMNPASEALTGVSRKDGLGHRLSEVFVTQLEDTGRKAPDLLKAALEGREQDAGENVVLIDREDREVPIGCNAAPIRDEQGDISGAVIVFRDEAERRGAQRALAKSERFLNTIFDSIYDPFCIIDRDCLIVRANEAYAKLKGRALSDFMGKDCHELLEGGDRQCSDCIVQRTFDVLRPLNTERHVTLADGTKSWLEILTYPIFDSEGRVTHVIQYSKDITSRRKGEDEKRRLILELEHLSRVDGLTGLLNRRALMDSLSQEVERCQRYGRKLSLMLCDIDRFKEINDTHGHAAGDGALVTVSQRLRDMVRKTDFVGRYGGDEFMLVMPETPLKGAVEFAERLRESVEGSVVKGEGGKIKLTLSVGVAVLASQKDSMDSLVTRADAALYEAKRLGRNRVATVKE